nr:tail fiber domain-containing protein [uncultured Brevundimonas sp.]
MSGLTITNLAQQVQDLLDKTKQQNTYLAAWLGGSADGGPNNDGRYPFVDLGGREILVPSPASFSDMTSGPAALAVAARVASDLARDLAQGHADRANYQRILSEAARGAAVEARNLAQQHMNHAGTSEANARHWAELARTQGEGSSADRAIVEQLAAETADNAALVAQDALNAAASAALAATFDPNLFDKKSDTLAASRLTGMIDPARIPVLVGQTPVVSSGGIANLTAGQQTGIMPGTLIATTDGRRWVYSGEGSKTAEASYIEQGDVTPVWSVIADKPLFFPTNIANVAGLQSALDGKSAVGHAHAWSEITGKPASFPATAHTHAISGVDGLQTALDGKVNLTGGHFTGQITMVASSMFKKEGVGNSEGGQFVMEKPDQFGFAYNTVIDINGSSLRFFEGGGDFRGAYLPLDQMPSGVNARIWTSVDFNPANYAAVSHTHTIGNVAGLQTALDGKIGSGSEATVTNLRFSTGFLYPDGNHAVMKTGPGGSERYWRFDANGTLYALNGGLYTNYDVQAMNSVIVGNNSGAESVAITKGAIEVRSQQWGGYIDFSDKNSAELDFGGRVQYAGGNFVISNGGGGSLVIGAGSVFANSTDGVQTGKVITENGTEQGIYGRKAFRNSGETNADFNSGNIHPSLEVTANAQGAAMMAFHRPGAYATYFGLGTDNQFRYGGWSAGQASWRFWTEGNLDANGLMRRYCDGWNTTTDGNERFYFSTNGRSHYRSRDGHEFRNSNDAWIARLDNGGTFETTNTISTLGNNMKIRGGSPTIYFKDTDNRSAMVHVNGNRFYILRGAGNDSETWQTVGNGWPLEIDLESNNAYFGASIYVGENDWFRVRGTSGVYWENYGGGWTMTDTSWIRAYNGKGIYSPGQIRGNTVVGESDIRLKENVQTITDATQKVEALTGVTFDWKRTGSAGMGFIAQDFEQVLPALVTEDTDGMKGVEYGPVVALLVEALKETNARVAALENGRV